MILDKLLQFPNKKSAWKILLKNFDEDANRLGYLRGLREGLKRQEEALGPNPILKDWLEIRNKIKDVDRLLKNRRGQCKTIFR